jgi:hypothetical protein
MNLNDQWKILLGKTSESIDLSTNPLTQRIPVWFAAKSYNNCIIITSSKSKLPASNIAGSRKIQYHEFEKLYPLYLRRKNKEAISKEVKDLSRNQVYIYSLIYNFLDQ